MSINSKFQSSLLLRIKLLFGSKWLVDFSAGKTQLVFFDHSSNTGAIDKKMVGLFLRKNHLVRFWDWLSFLNFIGALTLSLLLKLPPRKLEPWFVLWSVFLLRLVRISINLPYGHAWNTVVMFGLVLFLLFSREVHSLFW